MNISKRPFSMFQLNVMKARGLVKVQFYLEDFFLTGGQASFGRMQKFAEEITTVMFGAGGLEAVIKEQVGPAVMERFGSMDKEELQARAAAWASKMLPLASEIEALVKDVQAASEHALLEQALVATTSALEVYIHDVSVDAMRRSASVRKRFTDAMRERLSYLYSFYEVGQVRKHLRMLLVKDLLSDIAVRKKLARLLAYRNLIAHRSGLVDESFRSKTGYVGAIGAPVRIDRLEVEDSISFVTDFVASIEGVIHRASDAASSTRRVKRPSVP